MSLLSSKPEMFIDKNTVFNDITVLKNSYLSSIIKMFQLHKN